MKKYLSVLTAAAIAASFTGCNGDGSTSVEVSTPDSTANHTSEKSSDTVQSDTVVTLATIKSSPKTSVPTVFTSYVAESEKTEPPIIIEKVSVTTRVVHTTEADNEVTTETTAEQPTSLSSSSSAQTTETTTRPAPAHHDIIEAYINAVSAKIDSLLDMEYDTVAVSYTLYDMDDNGIPELIVKYGTCEDDFQHTFYTYDDFGMKVISDGTVGSHTGFAYDNDKKQFVSAYMDMGNAVLEWLNFSGGHIETDKTEEFEYNGEHTFEEQAAEYNVEWLPFALYSNSYEEMTWVYREVNNRQEYDEISGRDFSFIENYWS